MGDMDQPFELRILDLYYACFIELFHIKDYHIFFLYKITTENKDTTHLNLFIKYSNIPLSRLAWVCICIFSSSF